MQSGTRPFASNKVYHIEGLLKIAFILLALLSQFLARFHFYILVLGFVICILGLYRQQGRPRFSQEYLGDAMANDFGNSIFFILSILTVPSNGPFLYLPLLIHFLIGVAEFEPRTEYGLLKIEKVKNFLGTVQLMKNDMKIARSYIEFLNLFYFLVLIIMGKISIIFIIIYGNYIKFKYKLNPQSKWAIDSSKSFLTGKVANVPAVSGILTKGINGLFYLISA